MEAVETSAPDRPRRPKRRRRVLRTLGLGLITGAADDDPSAVGTYASAGAAMGPAILWAAPVMFPMTYAVVYLSAKIGQVSGKGLFHVIRDHFPRWVLYPALIGVVIGNVIEASADRGGHPAEVEVLVPVPRGAILVMIALAILALQVWASYTLIRSVFRWLALVLLAYIGSALLARPDWGEALRATLLPRIEFTTQTLSFLVAIIGTTLSAYLYTWQSNQEVEEEIAMGRTRLEERVGATQKELSQSRRDMLAGMFFANLVMYFIILATASTLFRAGVCEVETAAQAAEALRPIAGDAAGILFALGLVGVGALAVPVMTTGAAYDLCQAFGWRHGLSARPREARGFYLMIALFTAAAVGLNFLGFNPMKALVWSGIVQGFSTPPLLLLIMLITTNRTIMGGHTNSRGMNVLGWVTTAATFAATAGLVATWVL